MFTDQVAFIIFTTAFLTISMVHIKYKIKELKKNSIKVVVPDIVLSKLANKSSLKTAILVINSYSSFNSIIAFVGIVTETYLYGATVMLNYLSVSLGYVFAFFILEPFFYDLDNKIVTPWEYLEQRYKSKLIRITSTIVSMFFYFSFITMHLWGAATILSTVFMDLPFWVSCLIIGIFSISGSIFGGYNQLAGINCFQLILLIFVIAVRLDCIFTILVFMSVAIEVLYDLH